MVECSGVQMSSGNYSGIVDCIRKSMQADGVRGLYAGIGPTLAGIVPYAGINFMTYDQLKKYVYLLCGAVLSCFSRR